MFVGEGFHPLPFLLQMLREGAETLPYKSRHKIMLLYYFFLVNRKHNERESRALWSGLLPYSALNKFTGFNVTNLCAGRSVGKGL